MRVESSVPTVSGALPYVSTSMPARRSSPVPTFASPAVPLALSTSTVTPAPPPVAAHAQRMGAPRVEHAAIGLALMRGAIGGERAVGELVGRGCVAQRVVQPRRLEPAGALALGDVHCRRPRGEERRYTLDVRAALRGDDGPGGEGHRGLVRPIIPALKSRLGPSGVPKGTHAPSPGLSPGLSGRTHQYDIRH